MNYCTSIVKGRMVRSPQPLRYLSVCSGIEAATVAWHPMGMVPVAFSEIESFPCAVLQHHYLDVPNLGDMTQFKTWPDYAIDLLVGGTPCQSFSVAGLRKGLADPRGNLALTFLAIAQRYSPTWIVFENVPGLLSSDEGEAFGSFLGGLAELGYGFAYRILDAQFFRVAQRRRRVFVVGHLGGKWQRAAAVLFERAGLCGHPAPRRETREGVAPTLSARPEGGGGLGTDFDLDGGLDESSVKERTGVIPIQEIGKRESGTPMNGVCAFDTTQITSKTNRSNPQVGDPCHPLCEGVHAPAIAFSAKDSGADAQTELSPTLRALNHDTSHANSGWNVAEATPVGIDGGQIRFALRGTPSHSGDKGDGGVNTTLVAHALRADGFDAMEDGTGRGTPLVADCLQERDSKGSDSNTKNGHLIPVSSTMAVRRLTPRECERLQGFPDDYTLIPYGKKAVSDCPDGPRYKALGNSMCVNVMRWIGERILQVEAIP